MTFDNKRFYHRVLRYLMMLPAICLLLTSGICVAEQDTDDLFASVTVLPAFDTTIDNNYIDFGLVEPGESVTLKDGTYYNTIKCISNKGINYYVKINILDEIIGPKGNIIPPESFKWRIYHATGTGAPVSGWQDFSQQPLTVYTSGHEDETGNEVIIRFQYRLDLPPSARGGHYSIKVAYVLTEEQ